MLNITNFQNQKSSLKVQKEFEVVPDIEKIAEPTKDEELHSEHWADLFVTEADENVSSPVGFLAKKWYLCKMCAYQSSAMELMLKHMVRKHSFMDEGCFVCDFCNGRCESEGLLEQHLRKHMPEKQYVDDSWRNEFMYDEEIESGGTTCGKQWYVCKFCAYQSLTLELMIKHMIRKHSFIDGKCYVCGICQNRYMSEDILKDHLGEHVPDKQFVDDSWKKQFLDEEEYLLKQKSLKVKLWTKEEKDTLENVFQKQKYVEFDTKFDLAKKFHVSFDKVDLWFKNRRRSDSNTS